MIDAIIYFISIWICLMVFKIKEPILYYVSCIIYFGITLVLENQAKIINLLKEKKDDR